MNKTSRTAIIVASSSAIAIIGDVITYSLGASKGGKFRIAFPKGKDLLGFLAIGIVSGIAVDLAIRAIESRIKTDEEKRLEALIEEEIKKLNAGAYEGKKPTNILWV